MAVDADERTPRPARGRANAVQEWLARGAHAPLVRLALQWWRRYFEASRNSGCAATLYLFLSVSPFLLAMTGVFHAAGGDTNAFAQRLIEHQDLTGTTANLVRETFGTASSNALAASVAAVIGFLLWGIGVGQIYQDTYARAWRLQARTLSDQVRFTVWFFAVSLALTLFIVFAGTVKHAGWAIAIPAWLIASTAFWVWSPRYLLRRQIGFRALLPGAVLASLLIGGATATSPLFLSSWLNSDGKDFGSYGVAIALLAWGFILVTLSMACAVFSPVWAEWRRSPAATPGDTAPGLESP